MESAAKIGAGVGAGCLGSLMCFTAVVAGVLSILTGGLLGSFATPSAQAVTDIPAAMLTLYQQAAATCPGLPWSVLAAIGKVESDHGRAKQQVSTAGAVGPMQFLPATFQDYALPVPPGGTTPPTPWDAPDAVYAAARLLCANGARRGDLHAAVFAYNHDQSYTSRVLSLASTYAAAPADTLPPTQAAATAIAYARSQLGVPYLWGGQTPGVAWDCSGLVQSAYNAAGVHLPRTAQQQYDAGPALPAGAAILPGDLVFYGAGPKSVVHVAIAVSPTQMINAPKPGDGVKYDPIVTGQPIVAITRPTSTTG
ncbi:cell wall-associated NlpC family hydrolase [Streptacidiphilus sp. MAP12-16]|uniref:C40 family peptidase n=1 Tax=Streptacidiphilus sp. MAP12-16 TaxID=3156300 RepID=UPI003515BCAC